MRSPPLPLTVTKRPQPAGSSMRTGAAAPARPGSTRPGSLVGERKVEVGGQLAGQAPDRHGVAAVGVIDNSMTMSSAPMISARRTARHLAGPSTRMPSCSVPVPNSRTEQIIPSESRP